jgi:tetratricopeptide (TPR) repeat protein
LYRRALEAREQVLGGEHPSTLTSVNNLAGSYEGQGRYAEAEPLYRRALEARERVLGEEHPDTLISVNNLASLYESQGRYAEAEPLFQRALRGMERVLGGEHPNTKAVRENLELLRNQVGLAGVMAQPPALCKRNSPRRWCCRRLYTLPSEDRGTAAASFPHDCSSLGKP